MARETLDSLRRERDLARAELAALRGGTDQIVQRFGAARRDLTEEAERTGGAVAVELRARAQGYADMGLALTTLLCGEGG